MARNFVEKRIISKGVALCQRRIDLKGTPITADDLRNIEVKTNSPFLMGFYFVVGLAFVVFGTWVHAETRSMVYSFLPVLVGVGNCVFAAWGRPRKVRDMESELDLMDLTTEIVTRFVEKTEADRKKTP